jgi:ribosomal protein L16 Arg81 hydroxylase
MEGMVFNNLEQLLKPCLAGDFLAASWGRSYRYVPGWAGKFSSLLPWNQLNEILRRHRLDFPRLRLTRDGKSLPSTDYLRHVTSGRRRVQIPRLLPVKLTEQLRRGATLVLDAVDELYTPLEELAAGLESTFHEHVQINAYAGWRTSRGFDLHWDDHDVFILQVAGRKRWSVYGMTRPYPLARDVEPNQKPTHDPLWEAILEDGDLLYIPRGWWHVAFPLGEPTLHLTVGIHNRNGVDLLRWLADRLRASETFRKDLPRFASPVERAAHVESLRDELLAAWGTDVLEQYERDADAMAEARPHLSLPWSATPALLPPSNDVRVRLTTPRPLDLQLQQEQATIEFSCNGKRWRFAPAAMNILRPLNEGRACSVRELCAAAEGELDEQRVRTFLSELIFHGLLAVEGF